LEVRVKMGLEYVIVKEGVPMAEPMAP